MSEDDITPTQALARKCARSNLRLRDARALFDALYMADALMLSNGNKMRAARRAGIRHETIHRIRGKNEDGSCT